MQLNIKYEKDDWAVFQSYLEKNAFRSRISWYDNTWVNFVIWFFVALIFFTFFQIDGGFSWPTAGTVSVFFIFIYAQILLSGVRLKKAYEPLEDGTFIGEHAFTFDNEFIHAEGKGYRASHSWLVVKRLVKTEEAIYLFLDSCYAYIFPVSKLENPRQFYEFVSDKVHVMEN